jgi:hypothetical protein
VGDNNWEYLFVVIYEPIFLLFEFESTFETIIVDLGKIDGLVANHEIGLFV